MYRLLLCCFFLILTCQPAAATVEIALSGHPPVPLTEVYQREGTSFLAVDDVLASVGLVGRWYSVEHVYKFKTPRGTAVMSPGSQFIRIGGDFIPLAHKPRFIDSRLRVAEDFVTGNLQSLIGQTVYYRNLNPVLEEEPGEEGSLDRLFAFLLSKKKSTSAAVLRGIEIDPGHGGEDSGVIGLGGIKEKAVALDAARRLEKLVKMQMGIPVYMSRDDDYALTWKKRFEPATRDDVDALISIHAQGAFSPAAKGVTLFVRPQKQESDEAAAGTKTGESLRLANALKASLAKEGLSVGDIIEAPLLPLGRGDLPAVLIELGYLSNAEDKSRLTDSQGLDQVTRALYAGLKAYADKQKEFQN